MGIIRYGREELLQWKDVTDEDCHWEAVRACMELCTSSQLPPDSHAEEEERKETEEEKEKKRAFIIRYGKEELLQWKDASDEDCCWEAIVASIGAPLYQELCSLSELPDNRTRPATDSRRNIEKHHRAPPPSKIESPRELIKRGQVLAEQEEEEEEVEDEDGSDEEASLQPRAFQVFGEPCWDSGPPQDGFEYLRRVIWEAARCPKVKVAKISDKKLSKQTNYMPEIQPIPVCPVELLPSNAWVQEFLKDFSNLRTALASVSNDSKLERNGLRELPPIQDKLSWRRVCFGGSNSNLEVSNKQGNEERPHYEKCGNTEISLSPGKQDGESSSSFEEHENGESLPVEQQYDEGSDILYSQENHKGEESSFILEDGILRTNDVADVFSVSSSIGDGDGGLKDSDARISLHAPVLKTILRLDEVSRAALFQHHVSWLKEKGDLTYERAIWLFALSAVVDTPLDDLTSAAFRELLRICAELRIEKKKSDDELHILNILITIAGEYFGQADRCTEMGMNA